MTSKTFNNLQYSELQYTKDRHNVTRRHYNTLTKEHAEYFRNVLDEQRVITDNNHLQNRNVDFLRQFKGCSEIILQPKTTQEVSKILSYCNKNLLAVCPQGGNTGVSGASVPVFDEIIISAELMNEVISLDEMSGILICESGCVLENLNQFLDSKNLIMPTDIGSKQRCHIGGNIATNAGGFRLARLGSLHGNVLGLEVVKADGEILDCLKALRKDNTGYHLKNLFIGSEGTLGFITKVAVQCITKPKAIHVAFLGIHSYEKALQTYKLAKEELGEILSAGELIDDQSMQVANDYHNLKSPIGRYPFYLLIETFGSNKKHDSEKVNSFYKIALEKQLILGGIVTSEHSECQEIWKVRQHTYRPGSPEYYVFTYDVTLPLKHFYSIVEELREHAVSKVTNVYAFGHLADGNIHIHVAVRQYSEDIEEYLNTFIFKRVVDMNGSISGEHGLGFKHAKYLHLCRNKEYVTIMKNIKTIMDPNGILNPYKVILSEDC